MAILTWGEGSYQNEYELNQLHEAGLLKLDISKAKMDLNWSPKMNASQTVKYTLDWYKCFKNSPLKVNNFTSDQILRFLGE